MSYMTKFRTAGPVQTARSPSGSNLAGMEEPTQPNATNQSLGHLTAKNNTTFQIPYHHIDPRLLSKSDADRMICERNVAPASTHQSVPATKSGHHREDPPRTRSHCLRTCRVSKASENATPSLPSRASKRKQPKPCARSDDTNPGRASASRVGSEDGIRWKEGSMQWLDHEDHRWKPARYHRDCRAELISRAAQQPGAPVWTSKMGTDYTSFSPITQGWNRNPSSVIDTQGRKVLFLENHPAEWNRKPSYPSLTLNGSILLDHKNKPVRDIAGFPLTLSTKVDGWFLLGLRRCFMIEMKDIMARLPHERESNSGMRPLKWGTIFTQRIARWQNKNGVKDWFPRSRSGQAKYPPPPQHNPRRNSPLRRTGSLSSAKEDAWFSSRETSTSLDIGGYSESDQLPIRPYSSVFEHQPTPAYSSNPFEVGDNGMHRAIQVNVNDNLRWNPNDLTGTSAPSSGLEGDQRVWNPSSTPAHSHQRYYDLPNPTYANPYLDSQSSSIDSLFPAGDFRNTQPRTAAECDYIQNALEETRAQYRSWMSAEPPQTDFSASYAEQYQGIQAHLEKTWPPLGTSPVRLSSLGPTSEGLSQW